MIGWLQPAALWALLLIAAPVLIHLLEARRARRVVFPSLRFVRRSRTAAIRMQTPSDWMVLLVRMAIVALAVAATAQPLFLTSGRLATWNARVARAVVADTSASMAVSDGGSRTAADRADEAARAEVGGSALARRFDADDIGGRLPRAAAWLATTPPARREIVVISDMQRGSLRAEDLAGVPASMGIRFVPVGNLPSSRTATGLQLLGAPHIPSRVHELELSTTGTRTSTSPAPLPATGVRLILPASQAADRTRLLRTVATAGVPAPDERQPVAIRFAGGETPAVAPAPIHEPWMVRTILRLTEDEAMQRFARREEAALADGEPWFVVARNRTGEPLVHAAAAGPEVLIDVASPPSSLFAAAVLRSVLKARHGPVESPEAEVDTIPPHMLAAWSRPAMPVEHDGWRHAPSSDARWFWAAVLLLLAVEHVLRARRDRRAAFEDRRAAA